VGEGEVHWAEVEWERSFRNVGKIEDVGSKERDVGDNSKGGDNLLLLLRRGRDR